MTGLFENEERAPHLDLFTTHVKERLLELQIDVDPAVSGQGMALSTSSDETDSETAADRAEPGALVPLSIRSRSQRVIVGGSGSCRRRERCH